MADNTQLFFNEWNGKPVDYDGYFGFQCMDLANKYVTECLALPRLPLGNAWTQWKNYQSQYYTRIPNTPSFVPQKGDIIIWKKVFLYLPDGHIAIFDQGNVNNFVSFDQNWSSKHCQYEHHNYRFIQGVLRKK